MSDLYITSVNLSVPSGERFLLKVKPPGNVDGANDVMRKLEVWLGSKDVSTARYISTVDSMPYPGYEPTNNIIYTNLNAT